MHFICDRPLGVNSDLDYPENHPATIAVGASTRFDYHAEYSSYGEGLDFVAPGNDIWTTDRMGGDGYANENDDPCNYIAETGTTYASPLAAGVAALMLSEDPNLTADEVRSIMQQTCRKIGGVVYDANGWNKYYGYGCIDAYAAVRLASEIPGVKTFGGSSSDVGFSIQQTSDGGYIIAGYTDSFGSGGRDVYLIKTDSSGNLQWTKTFGGSSDDWGQSVQQTSDGGYIIAGVTYSFSAGNCDVYLIKTNSSGNTQWTKTFGGSFFDYGRSVQQTSDGGYIIAGYTYSFGTGGYDVYLIKTNSSGNLQWTKTFGGSDNDHGCSVQQTSDGGYIIAGYTDSFGAGGADVYLIKTNSSGNTQWTKTFGGSDSDLGYSVQQTFDGGYIIAGYTESFVAGEHDVYLIKTNSSGNLQWTKTFGGSDYDSGRSVQQTSDGGYIIAGYTESFGADGRDVYLIKTNSSGNLQWTKTFGGSDNDHGCSVQQTSDGGYIIAGSTQSFGAGERDVYLIKTDSSGNLKW